MADRLTPIPPGVSAPYRSISRCQVEGTDLRTPGEHLLVEVVRGDYPGDLELQPVRVVAVERLGRAVVRGSDERTRVGELGGDLLEVAQRVDLPRQVVEAHTAAPGRRGVRAGAHPEQTEVVIVRRAGGPQERRRAATHLADDLECQDVAVEGDAAVGVADVENGVVQAVDRHASRLPHFS